MTDILLRHREADSEEQITPARAGDSIKVHVKVREGEKERIQIYRGVVIAGRGEAARETFAVRRISGGVGVERKFPLHSPLIAGIGWSGRARSAGPSCTTSATARARPHASPRSRRTGPLRPGRDPRPPGRSVRGAGSPARISPSWKPSFRGGASGGSPASTRPGAARLAGAGRRGRRDPPAPLRAAGARRLEAARRGGRARVSTARSAAARWRSGSASSRRRETSTHGDILRASLEAMRIAVSALTPAADFLLVDAVTVPGVWTPQLPVIHGDALSASIAAASVVAKVHRDSLLDEMSRRHPAYGFEQHKGYGTPEHWEALRLCGPCPEHRLTYRGVIPDAIRGPPGSPAGARRQRLESSRVAVNRDQVLRVRREAAFPGQARPGPEGVSPRPRGQPRRTSRP